MKSRKILASVVILLLGPTAAAMVSPGHDVGQRDALSSLRRALAQAGATALTADQETQLNTLITNYRNAIPDNDDALEAARDAFDAAVLAGDQTAAQAQATTIANLTAAQTGARLAAEAQFEIAVLALLRTGGQLDPLVTRYGNDRILSLVETLIGRSPGRGR